MVAPHAGAWIETKASMITTYGIGSRPTRARGLKLPCRTMQSHLRVVAPHAGAWIETQRSGSLCRCVDVAPHAGAWIETAPTPSLHFQTRSRPTRARGLKRVHYSVRTIDALVAPHAGAWIETNQFSDVRKVKLSRPTRARGLKPSSCRAFSFVVSRSRPTRARGLKR